MKGAIILRSPSRLEGTVGKRPLGLSGAIILAGRELENPMSDERTRLKRLWEASGDPADERRYLQYLMRLGELSPEQMLFSQSRWEGLRGLLEGAVQPLICEADGFPLKDITEREAALGIRFPLVLSEFYQLFGRHRALVNRNEALRQVYDLVLEETLLIIHLARLPGAWYQDKAPLLWYGIRREHLSQENPPVQCDIRDRAGENHGSFQSHDSVLSFLAARVRHSRQFPSVNPVNRVPYQHFHFPISSSGHPSEYRALAKQLHTLKENDHRIKWVHHLAAYFSRFPGREVPQVHFLADHALDVDELTKVLSDLESPLLEGLESLGD